MAHSALHLRLMLDWIRSCSEGGEPMPNDADIVDRFGFSSVEQARTLLADLSDRGQITIRGIGIGIGIGAERTIQLGRQRGAMAPAPRPVPSVTARRPDPAIDAAVSKIKTILAGDAKPMAARVPSPQVAAPAQDATPSAKIQRRQLNLSCPTAVFDELSVRADAEGMMPGPYALQIVTAAMQREKLFMPAAATKAAQIAGASIHDFASMLIRIGLEHYLAAPAMEATE